MIHIRDASTMNADQLIRDLQTKLDSQTMQKQSEKDAWELKLRNFEETWQGILFILNP